MKRRVFTILSALSLLLCVAVVVLWVRSYLSGDVLRYHSSGGDRYGVLTGQGTILVEHQWNEIYHGGLVPPRGWDWRTDPESRRDFRTAEWSTASQWRVYGYGVVINRGVVAPAADSARPGAWRNFVLIFPYWLPLLVFSVPPVLTVLHWRRERRSSRSGLCPSCGYDLRATPGRCPECGLVPAAPPPPPRGNDR